MKSCKNLLFFPNASQRALKSPLPTSSGKINSIQIRIDFDLFGFANHISKEKVCFAYIKREMENV